MNKCPKCLNSVEEGQNFCPCCGYDLRSFSNHAFTVCPKCGQTYPEPADICSACGYTTLPAAAAKDPVYENKLAGTVGAFLFAVTGGIAFFLLNKIGFVASISGLVGIVCALKGYEKFGGKLSRYGVIISLLATVFMIVLGWYLGFAQDVYDAYRSWYADGYVDYVPSFGECVASGYVFLFDEDVNTSYLINLLLGLVFTGIGCWRTVYTALKVHTVPKAVPDVPES